MNTIDISPINDSYWNAIDWAPPCVNFDRTHALNSAEQLSMPEDRHAARSQPIVAMTVANTSPRNSLAFSFFPAITALLRYTFGLFALVKTLTHLP